MFKYYIVKYYLKYTVTLYYLFLLINNVRMSKVAIYVNQVTHLFGFGLTIIECCIIILFQLFYDCGRCEYSQLTYTNCFMESI